MSRQRRIMIIDDDPSMRKTLEDILGGKGYRSVAAGSGEDGLALLAESAVDVVLIDLGLPDMHGLAVLDRVTADHPNTEAIILTGNASLETAVSATNRGAFSYLLKPYDIEQLLLQVRRAIEKQRAEEEIVRHNLELRSIHEQMKKQARELESANDALAKEIRQHRQAREEVESLNLHLRKRTDDLEVANRELEAFSYSVSHDLRAPLRHMTGYSKILREDYADKLDGTAASYLEKIERAGNQMGQLIDALLQLSRINRAELDLQTVDLSRMAGEIVAELRQAEPERDVAVEVASGISTKADPMLMRPMLQNLLGNAWKYTRDVSPARTAFRAEETGGRVVYSVRDNGAGFDMADVDKVFGAFQRLHGTEYEGSGIGLATVQRIVERHQGRVWAEAARGKGATFYFTLGMA